MELFDVYKRISIGIGLRFVKNPITYYTSVKKNYNKIYYTGIKNTFFSLVQVFRKIF